MFIPYGPITEFAIITQQATKCTGETLIVYLRFHVSIHFLWYTDGLLVVIELQWLQCTVLIRFGKKCYCSVAMCHQSLSVLGHCPALTLGNHILGGAGNNISI